MKYISYIFVVALGFSVLTVTAQAFPSFDFGSNGDSFERRGFSSNGQSDGIDEESNNSGTEVDTSVLVDVDNDDMNIDVNEDGIGVDININIQTHSSINVRRTQSSEQSITQSPGADDETSNDSSSEVDTGDSADSDHSLFDFVTTDIFRI